MLGGWSISFYIIQLIFKNLKHILKEHWHLAIGITFIPMTFYHSCIVLESNSFN